MKDGQDVLGEGGSVVTEFYRGGHIFITGGTGFIGKALGEKLLRSCSDIEHIYLLIRSKKGSSVEERWKELLKNNVYDRIRASGVLKKIEPIAGDVLEADLGLSEADKHTLIDNVTVVFHSAATVKFNERLQFAVKVNTMGTQNVLNICKHMKKLKSVIYVSTAYSNINKAEIDEEVYPAPANPQAIIECVNLLDEELVDELGDSIIKCKRYPNTYTITKAMAENIVADYSDILPVGIVRPSIVSAAWKEPFHGWLDNISLLTGIIMEGSKGTLWSMVGDPNATADVIPVDLLIDTLIVAAWHSAIYRRNSVPIYNCTSGRQHPVKWGELARFSAKHTRNFPTKYAQRYPDFSFTTNRVKHYIKDLALHSFPAFLFDISLRFQGSKPFMMKLYRRMKIVCKSAEFVTLNEWDFVCNNQISLEKDMSAEDKSIFMTDIKQVDWDEYFKRNVLGIRKYVLKDSLDSLPAARSKIRRLWWYSKIGQLLMIFLAIIIIF